MTIKVFAADTPKDGHGWYLFPARDTELRRKHFVPESMEHPAKMNLHLQQAIIDYVSEPGQVLLDPMAGTGSLMMAALSGRRVICNELEVDFHNMQKASKEMFLTLGVKHMDILLTNQDCRDLLPFPVDHIITSPPYATAFSGKGSTDSDFMRSKYRDTRFDTYSGHAGSARNISRLNTFFYNMEMPRIYKLYYDSLRPGGTCTLVIKDIIEDGKRTLLGVWALRKCLELGFELDYYLKWYAKGGAFQDIRRSRGELTVDDEDIIILRRAS